MATGFGDASSVKTLLQCSIANIALYFFAWEFHCLFFATAME